jgi:D-glycero-alpha-D-manno-heptose-7-phosphate kinase
MLLCYTGRTRSSDQIIEHQTENWTGGDERALAGLRASKDLALAMKNALLQRRLTEFGELLGAAWEQKKQLSSKISNDFIDTAYATAIREGALGGKVTGAGGGGYMLFYCPFQRRHRVANALLELGGEVTEFAFTSNGLTTWSVHE